MLQGAKILQPTLQSRRHSGLYTGLRTFIAFTTTMRTHHPSCNTTSGVDIPSSGQLHLSTHPSGTASDFPFTNTLYNTFRPYPTITFSQHCLSTLSNSASGFTFTTHPVQHSSWTHLPGTATGSNLPHTLYAVRTIQHFIHEHFCSAIEALRHGHLPYLCILAFQILITISFIYTIIFGTT